MKNDYCRADEDEIIRLDIPLRIKGLLLSPFQHNRDRGFVLVPEDAFHDMIDAVTVYAKLIDSAGG